MPAALTIPSVFTAIDRFSAPMKKMTSNMEAFAARSQRALTWANNGFNKLISPITALNNQLMGLGYYVGLYSLVRVLQNAIKTFAAFEQAQVDLSVVLQDNSIPLMAKLSTQARTLAVTYGELAPNILKVQTALAKMGFGGEQIFNMTPAIIAGARAFQASPERVSEVAAGILLSYEKDSSQTKDVINKLAYAANLTAADFESFATQLPIVNRVAKLSGQSYEQVLAYLGTLRNVQIHTATGATSLKNILIDAGKRGQDFDTAIRKVAASNNAVIYAYNKFGKRSVVSAVEFAHQLDSIKTLVEKIRNAPENYVEDLARKQLQTFNGSVKLMRSAWDEFILSIESGKGPIATSLKNIIQIATAILLLSANTEAARTQLEKMNIDVVLAAQKYSVWLKWIGYIAAALVAAKIALIAFNIVLGAYNALIVIWAGVTKLAAGAMFLFNAALAANPIGLIILAISAFLTIMALAIDRFDTWGALMLAIMGPFGNFASLIITISRHWEQMTKAFSERGFIAGIKEIGKTIIDWILYPMQQLSQLIYSLTNIKAYDNAARAIEMTRKYMMDEGTDKTTPVNPKATEQQNFMQMIQNGRIGVDFSNVPNGTNITTSTPNIMPNVKSTSDAYFLNPSY
jgi:hypothetical protein